MARHLRARLKPQHAGYGLCFLFIVFVLTAISFSPRGKGITDKLYDSIRTTDTRSEVAIVGIDDKSLKEFGAWPWDRSVFARLATALTTDGVKVAVYDVLFLEPRNGDTAFQKALISSTTTTILGAKRDGANY